MPKNKQFKSHKKTNEFPKQMHPRNIYIKKLNFKQMAIDYPEFRKISKQDISGQISINFKDIESLRVLTKTLLKKDFDLEVFIPENHLVPTMSLRLNYILWIEDLLEKAERKEDINGIDIGTGASCVYPLLGAKKNNWNMVGTEIDQESTKYAEENVSNNNLSDKVKVILTKEDLPLFSFMDNTDKQYDFCMCNPPFYSSLNELSAKLQQPPTRMPPHSAPSGKESELTTKGGESEFINRIISESINLKDKIRIYSSMVGHKKILPDLVEKFKSEGITNFTQTEFFQGYTSRWGVAWTFCEDIKLTEMKINFRTEKYPEKKKPPSIKTLDVKKSDSNPTLDAIVNKVKNHFEELELKYSETIDKEIHSFEVTAFENTWTNQRRKRREEERKQKANQNNESEKRPAETSPDEPDPKKLKLDTDTPNETIQPFLTFTLAVQSLGTIYQLSFMRMGGTGGNDLIQQILQFFKNRLVT